jgi:FAD:protein FMN transferase
MMQQTYMQSMQALGTTVELRLVAPSMAVAEAWFTLLWKETVSFEHGFSRFISDSELSQFNLHAGEKTFVSKTCKDILEKAKQFGEITGGIFNPFVLPSLQRVGYVDSMTPVDADDAVSVLDFSDRDVVAYTQLKIGDDWARIPAQSAIDLGGIGKGYLADHLASLLTTPATNPTELTQIESYCFSLGGDIIAKGTDERNQKWRIDIQSSRDRLQSRAYFVSDEDMVGVATSGTVRKKEGKEQEHQINPASQAPTETQYALCSVASHNAITADVIASSILVGGENLANTLLKDGVISGVLLQDAVSENPLVLGKGFTLL